MAKNMQELLPKTQQEFSTSAYWDKFFRNRGNKAFEWYGEYAQLSGILHKYIKPSEKTLVIGCGNSSLSADLYDLGYSQLVNIDISDVVIRQMSQKHLTARPNLKFLRMDVTQMDFEDCSFSVAFDKGTLDALMPDNSAESIQTVDKMFNEIGRVLRIGGRYICVSLAQEHVFMKMLTYFTFHGWMVRVCRIPTDSEEFPMPVFAYVLTKFKQIVGMKSILEVCEFEDKVKRFDDVKQLIQSVKSLQYYGILRQQLNKGKCSQDDHVSLELYSCDSDTPRYMLHVVDSELKASTKKFGIFLVPEGRETEWLFSTTKGRIELALSCGFERLVVVTLNRDQKYTSLDSIKSEISSKIIELAPPGLANQQAPILSVGDDIHKRELRYKGQSSYSGEFVVEDVDVDGVFYRRLIFMSNTNLVQSEVRLLAKKPKRKKKKVPTATLR